MSSGPSPAILIKYCHGYRTAGVTLKDFKEAFGRHGNYRFFFKTEDPDCGVVKEEVGMAWCNYFSN